MVDVHPQRSDGSPTGGRKRLISKGKSMNEHPTRAERDQDVRTVRDLTLAAFPTDLEASIVDRLRLDRAWIEGLSVLALDDTGAIMGHALLSRCHIGEAPSLLLGPVSVWPQRQRQGYGSAAIRAALEAAQRLDERHIVVVGHPDYYPRFGFQRASTFGITTSDGSPDEAVMALTLDSADPLPAGVVAYAAPFAS
jgi:putative acetyltransferase